VAWTCVVPCVWYSLAGSGIAVSLTEPGPIATRFRDNAISHFRRHIDIDRSHHREAYRAQLERLERPDPAAPFTSPPAAVVDSASTPWRVAGRRPAHVTVPTLLIGHAHRLLPTRGLDRLLARICGGGRR